MPAHPAPVRHPNQPPHPDHEPVAPTAVQVPTGEGSAQGKRWPRTTLDFRRPSRDLAPQRPTRPTQSPAWAAPRGLWFIPSAAGLKHQSWQDHQQAEPHRGYSPLSDDGRRPHRLQAARCAWHQLYKPQEVTQQTEPATSSRQELSPTGLSPTLECPASPSGRCPRGQPTSSRATPLHRRASLLRQSPRMRPARCIRAQP